jgi:hypothetical protein
MAMHRLFAYVFAGSFLLGVLTGCTTTTSSCSSPCGCGSSTACSTGACGSGCGGSCNSGDRHRLGLLCHTNGICDCDYDEDPCAHRAPWARHALGYPTVGTGVAVNGAATTTVAPSTTPSTSIPAPAPIPAPFPAPKSPLE